MKKGRLVVIVIALIIIYWWSDRTQHRVFINATVLTVNNNNDIFEAVSVRDGRVEAVGRNFEIERLIASNTLVTDLSGKTLIPGFFDAHSHFPSSGLSALTVNLSPPPIGSTQSLADIQTEMGKAVQDSDEGRWILGFAYDDSLLAEKRHPTRNELDVISKHRPIYLWHSSGHMGVANSAGLAKLGIDENTEVITGGVIGRDAVSGKLNGLLQEKAAPSLAELTRDFSFLDYYQILQTANADYSSHGITTAQSGAANESLLKALYWVERLGLLAFRLVVLPRHDSLGKQILDGEFDAKNYNSDWFQVGPLKLFADGSPQGYTAYLSQPYYKPPADDTGYRGFPAIPQTELIDFVNKYQKVGIQLAIHGNGDAAIDNILEAFDMSQRDTKSTSRNILMHAQMARIDQLDKMSRLDITPSFFNTHTYYWGDVHSQNAMGPKRAAAMSAAASAEKFGLRFSLHSDAPVTPINPLQLIWSAVNRETLSGAVIGGDERISIMSALRAVTIDAAWQVFQDNNRGSIEVGKFADLVVLSGDLLAEGEDIRALSVIETIVNGETVFSAGLD